ncbi:MAG TPA: hypothetical protein VI365_11570, partial [Trebonia sp.]
PRLGHDVVRDGVGARDQLVPRQRLVDHPVLKGRLQARGGWPPLASPSSFTFNQVPRTSSTGSPQLTTGPAGPSPTVPGSWNRCRRRLLAGAPLALPEAG